MPLEPVGALFLNLEYIMPVFKSLYVYSSPPPLYQANLTDQNYTKQRNTGPFIGIFHNERDKNPCTDNNKTANKSLKFPHIRNYRSMSLVDNALFLTVQS